MRAETSRMLNGAQAVLIERPALCRHGWLKIALVFSVAQRFPLQIRNFEVQ